MPFNHENLKYCSLWDASNIALCFLYATLLCAGCATQDQKNINQQPSEPGAVLSENNLSGNQRGPTVFLEKEHQGAGTPIYDFMYFIPLLSPEPVSVTCTKPNTQSIKFRSITRKAGTDNISLALDFDLNGQGSHQFTFDNSHRLKRFNKEFKQGRSMNNLLDYISFTGNGIGRLKAEGTRVADKTVIQNVTIYFPDTEKGSSVEIGLFSVRHVDEKAQRFNEKRVGISALTFTRSDEKPKMKVDVASVKDRDAADTGWENFKAALKGTLANFVIPPLAIETQGNKAVLDISQAIYNGDRQFTFPLAKNIIDQRDATSIPKQDQP